MKIITTVIRFLFGTTLFAAALLPFSAPSTLGSERSHPEPGILPGPRLPDDDCLPRDPPPPVIKIKVRVPACSTPGQTIEYRICLENCSTAEAHHVVLKNALPNNAKFVSADPEPAQQTPELQWQLGTIGGGAVREIRLRLQPNNQEDVKNCLRVQFEHGQCLVTRQSAYPSPPGLPPGMPPDLPQPYMPPVAKEPTKPGLKPPVITTIPEAIKPVLGLEISGPKDQYVNLSSRYQIAVTNRGKTKAMNTQLSVRIPDTLKVEKVNEQGASAGDVVAWNLGHLEPGETKLLELFLRASDKGEYCFRATAKADLGVTKEADHCTKFVGVSTMTIEMYGREGVVFLGEKNSYPIVIRNQGTAPLTNVRLKAFVPSALKLAPGTNAKYETLPPVQGGQWIEFLPLPKIDVGERAKYEISVEAVQAGVTRFHIEVYADQLDNGRPVIEEELTVIVDDRDPMVKGKQQSRKKNASK